MRLLGAEPLAKEHQFLGPGHADRQREQPRDPAGDTQTNGDLWEAECGVRRRDDQITAQGELAPRAEGVAVHGRDDRERRLPDQAGHVLYAIQPPLVLGLAERLALLPQVVTCAE